MLHSLTQSCVLALSCVVLPADEGNASESFELLDGDRVVFVGNTFIERDQAYGYLETMLTARWPDRNITFGNLGWSGDTVWGEARARFGSAADGFQHLKEHVEAIKPTVLFVGYGANEAFDGEAGLPKFEKGLNTLLDMLAAAAAPNARMILLLPLPQENLGPPLPDPTRHNEDIASYSKLIFRVSEQRGHQCIQMVQYRFRGKVVHEPIRDLTDNGVHLTDYGYWNIGLQVTGELDVFARGSGFARRFEYCEIRIETGGNTPKVRGFRVSEIEPISGGIRFTATADRLPKPNSPNASSGYKAMPLQHRLSVDGLTQGSYVLRIDGRLNGKLVDGSFTVTAGPDFDQVEQLRQAIIEKNHLYFHRWRPQNETYLFGFRKHEQGNNAVEIAKFDPLIEEQEKLIAKLRVPVIHTYELVRTREGDK